MGFREYKFKKIKGIDDLKSIHAFHGNSQGDSSCSNDPKIFIDSDGWMSVSSYFEDIDYLNPEEVNKRSEEIKLWNEQYLQELKDTGEYGKEFYISFSLEEDPLLDNINPIEKTSSYEYHIWDFSEGVDKPNITIKKI